jgi:hypothetical protein
MPEQTRPDEQVDSGAGAPPGRSGHRRAAAINYRLLDRTREMIRSVGRQLAARRGNLARLTGNR